MSATGESMMLAADGTVRTAPPDGSGGAGTRRWPPAGGGFAAKTADWTKQRG